MHNLLVSQSPYIQIKRAIRHEIAFIKHQDFRNTRRIDLSQRVLNDINMINRTRMARIHHVQNHIRLSDFFQCGTKRRGQCNRQLLNEAHCIGQQHNTTARQLHPARSRIERRKKLVGNVNIRARKRIEQRRFSRIRIAHQRDRWHSGTAPLTAMPLTVRSNLLKLLFELRDFASNLAAVHFKLRFTRATQPNTARSAACCATSHLPRKVGPLTSQARKAVFILRQLNLERSLTSLCMLRKNIENQRRTIQYLNSFTKCLFKLALVPWRQLIVKNHHARAQLSQLLRYFFYFTRTNKRRGIGTSKALDHAPNDLHTGCVHQQQQLIQRILNGKQRSLFPDFHAN